MQTGSVRGDTVKVFDIRLLVACTSGEEGAAVDRLVNDGDVGSLWRSSAGSSDNVPKVDARHQGLARHPENQDKIRLNS